MFLPSIIADLPDFVGPFITLAYSENSMVLSFLNVRKPFRLIFVIILTLSEIKRRKEIDVNEAQTMSTSKRGKKINEIITF